MIMSRRVRFIRFRRKVRSGGGLGTVASEERAILAEIEKEEDKAMQRIRVEEAESLAKVQKAWVDRQEWLTEARDALRVQREAMAQDQRELDARKSFVGERYKDQTAAFNAAFGALQKHQRAIWKEVRALRNTSAKAEMTNIILSEQIRHSSNELTRARNAAFGEEEALKAELRALLPHYAAPLDLSDIRGPHTLPGEGGASLVMAIRPGIRGPLRWDGPARGRTAQSMALYSCTVPEAPRREQQEAVAVAVAVAGTGVALEAAAAAVWAPLRWERTGWARAGRLGGTGRACACPAGI